MGRPESPELKAALALNLNEVWTVQHILDQAQIIWDATKDRDPEWYSGNVQRILREHNMNWDNVNESTAKEIYRFFRDDWNKFNHPAPKPSKKQTKSISGSPEIKKPMQMKFDVEPKDNPGPIEFTPEAAKLAETISLTTPEAARKSTSKLTKAWSSTTNRDLRRQLRRMAILAATQAKYKKKDVVHRIYQRWADQHNLVRNNPPPHVEGYMVLSDKNEFITENKAPYIYSAYLDAVTDARKAESKKPQDEWMVKEVVVDPTIASPRIVWTSRELLKVPMDQVNPKTVYPEELKMGLKEEREHLALIKKMRKVKMTDTAILTEIAMAHLREDPHYYSKLKQLF